MSSFFRTIAMSTVMGATILACPLTAMAADSVTQAASQAAPATTAPEAPLETVEMRIASLHASLAITPGEEADWNGVTKTMRENAAVMEKLVAEKSAKDPVSMSAVDDLMTYEKFARAHVQGLKKLTSSFATLYKTMPDAQKKVADDVFQNFGREKAAGAHS
jgi:periplasmic protein CpxP/Spy